MMDNYLQQIRKQLPDIEINTCRLIETGEKNDVLIIDDRLVFRFPKFEEAVAALKAEVRLLTALRGRTNLAIPDPVYQAVVGNAAGEAFVGYAMIPGEPLWRETVRSLKNASTAQRLATQLATFLGELHSIADIDAPLRDDPGEWQTMYERIRSQLFAYMRPDAQVEVARHFESYLSHPFDFEPRLRHGDFGTVNILYDGSSITGIIDFGNAGLGDPAVDIAAILAAYGPEFLERFEVAYPAIGAYVERAQFYIGTFALQEALYGIEHDDDEAFHAGIAPYR